MLEGVPGNSRGKEILEKNSEAILEKFLKQYLKEFLEESLKISERILGASKMLDFWDNSLVKSLEEETSEFLEKFI